MTFEPKETRRSEGRIGGRVERLRALWGELEPVLRTHLRSIAIELSEIAAAGSVRVRQGLAHSFETRIAVAAVVVLASAVVGYQLGGRFAMAGSDDASESLDDVLAHAEHAFDLRELGSEDVPEGVDVESGELVAQYAPVSIDALPVHQDTRERLTLATDEAPGFAGSLADANPFAGGIERATLRSADVETPRLRKAGAAEPARGGDELTLVTRGEIGKRESLATSLRRQGVSPAAIHLISTELRKVFDFRRSRAGDTYRLSQDSDGRVLDFAYAQGQEESYTLTSKGSRYVASKQTETLEPHVAKIAGVVDGSFYDAITALGEQSSLATEFAKILAWDMDFSRSVHPGDEFAILYERLYAKRPDGESVYVRPGKILAGRYSGRLGEHTVVYYENSDGVGAYFRPDGSTIERAFLAAPLEFSRITSRFTNARRHPILNITRPHPGIDYAAPYGTPIFAIGDGIVEFRARNGASGNLVRIRHTGGYTSHYAHLSNFARGLKVGDRVKQKQIIGYVGSTGLSTGPHVCFRMKKNGQWVDPLRMAKPAGPTIEYDRIDHFRDVRDRRLADLGQGPFVAANEAL